MRLSKLPELPGDYEILTLRHIHHRRCSVPKRSSLMLPLIRSRKDSPANGTPATITELMSGP
jgi:hypothetical protein